MKFANIKIENKSRKLISRGLVFLLLVFTMTSYMSPGFGGPRIAYALTAPTLVDYQQSSWSTRAASPEVTASITWQTGDFIVVFGATETQGVTFATPTATGLTFALVTS